VLVNPSAATTARPGHGRAVSTTCQSTKYNPGYFCGCPGLEVAADGTLVAVSLSYEDEDGEMCLHVLRLRDIS